MQTSLKAIELIKHHEGVRFRPYRCPARLHTVGVGHVMYPEQGKLKVENRDEFLLRPEDNRVWTKDEVNAILRNDLARFERGIYTLFPVNLSQGMFDSLVSFSFNCGLGTTQRSTLRQKVLRGDKAGAADEFLKYTKGGGKVLPGLVKRRQDERALFLHP